jgi:tetratricopeptide (TPR) repeat protein
LFQANTIGERGIRSNGPGNEHAVIKKLLWDAIQRNDDHIINLSLRLGVNYSTKLKESCRYRDACVATGELLSLITGLNLDNQHVELSILRGQSLRMVGQMEDALEVLYSAIEMGNGFIKNKSLSDVYLSIALIHDKSGNKQDVIIAANKVQELTQKDSGKYLQAEAIKARYIDDISLKKNKLFELEQKARNTNHNIVANNIAVELARSSKNKNEKLSLFEKVISCNEDPYNRIRATISKSMYLINEDRITEINKKDIQFLGFAYSFLFAQRMSVLFNDCHIVIWTLLKSEGNIIKLLRAFRLSSFLWRIRGEEYLEKKYLEDIDPQDIKNIYDTRNENTMIDINYFERRRQLMLI